MLIKPYKIYLITLLFVALASCTIPLRNDAIAFQTLHTPQNLRVLFLENHTRPTVTLYLGFKKSGIDYDPQKKQGLVMLITKILQANKDKYFSGKLNQAVSITFYEMPFDTEHFHFRLESPPEQLAENISILMKCLKVSLDQGTFQKLLNLQIAEAKKQCSQLKDPDNLALHTLLNQALFKCQPQAGFTLGTPETLRAIRTEDVKNYIQAHFTQENLIIGASGNIKPLKLIEAIEQTLGKLPQSANKPLKAVQTTISGPSKHYIFQEIPNSIIVLGYPWLDPTHPEYYAAKILGIQLDSWIQLNFLKSFHPDGENKSGNNYYQATESFATLPGCNLRVARLYTENKFTLKSIELIKALFKQAKTSGIPEKGKQAKNMPSVKKIKKILVKDVESRLAKVKTDHNFAAYYLFNLQAKVIPELADLQDVIPRIQVLRQKDVNRLAHILLDTEKIAWVEIGRENHIL